MQATLNVHQELMWVIILFNLLVRSLQAPDDQFSFDIFHPPSTRSPSGKHPPLARQVPGWMLIIHCLIPHSSASPRHQLHTNSKSSISEYITHSLPWLLYVHVCNNLVYFPTWTSLRHRRQDECFSSMSLLAYSSSLLFISFTWTPDLALAWICTAVQLAVTQEQT